MGYYRAGFDIVGVDIEPQPHYPFHFVQADALTFPLDGYDVIHASPPCQDYSCSRYISHPKETAHNGKKYPRLIEPMRHRLETSGIPWIIENVGGAYLSMPDALMLCGTSFGLRVWRHRLFSSSHLLFGAGPCNHQAGDISVRRKRGEYIGIGSGVTYQDGKGHTRKRPKFAPVNVCAEAMGIDWMTGDELGEAIPPAYTEFLGRQLMRVVQEQRSMMVTQSFPYTSRSALSRSAG